MKNRKSFKVGIIGAGLIGFKRANAILELRQDTVTGVYGIKKPVMSSAKENFEVMKIMDGLYRAAKTGKLVKISS